MTNKVSMPVAPDLEEISEWLEAFDQVVAQEGLTRGAQLLGALSRHARDAGVELPARLNTPYINTISAEEDLPYPGDRVLERRIESFIRWNAMAMVHRQNKKDAG